MKDYTHAKEFGIQLAALAETFNKTLSKTAIRIYYEALKPYSFNDVNRALNILVRQSKFMPTIAEIVEIIEDKKSPDALAEQAYNKLIRARKEVGAYASIIFDDPIIHRIVEQHGGWPAVCAMSKEEEQFTAFKKNFIQEYKAFMQDKNFKYPKELAGICAISNNANGFDNYIPPPVIFGDEEKALEWVNKQIEQLEQIEQNKDMQAISDKEINKLVEKMSGKNGY